VKDCLREVPSIHSNEIPLQIKVNLTVTMFLQIPLTMPRLSGTLKYLWNRGTPR
jgi:hypothetical protein